MKFPLDKVLSFDKNKYEIVAVMIKFVEKIEEEPEILLNYPEKDRDKLCAIVVDEVLSGKLEYKYKSSAK